MVTRHYLKVQVNQDQTGEEKNKKKIQWESNVQELLVRILLLSYEALDIYYLNIYN